LHLFTSRNRFVIFGVDFAAGAFVPVIVITGASSGIGEAIALQYASSRACQWVLPSLFINSLRFKSNDFVFINRLVLAARSRDKLKKVAVQCRKLGCEVRSVLPHPHFRQLITPSQVAIIPTDVSKAKQCKCVFLYYYHYYLFNY
jgi:NAD(P)-dependent dehydrogenase (short-subunit alcohol dehydrogenase family)